MKFKREIIAIILVICVLFMISAVSAADSLDEAVGVANASEEVATMDLANDNNLATENSGEILGETDDGTYANLSEKITNPTGTTVDLWNNYTFGSGNSAISISTANLVIDGHGVTTIDANGVSRIFDINGSGVTIKNINFINGYSEDSSSGGAIKWTNSGTLLNCTFENNVATTNGGGAIYWSGTTATITNCTFIENSGTGGAIFSYTDGMILKNCNFIKNLGTNAGAVYFCYSATNIDQCRFINNSGSYCGALYIIDYGNCFLRNSIFLNNGGTYIIDFYDRYQYTLTASNNWFGNTEENLNPPEINDFTLINMHILELSVDDNTGIAHISLNKLNDGSSSSYKLPKITFDLSSINATLYKDGMIIDTIALDENGEATFNYVMNDIKGSLTIDFNNVKLTKNIKEIGNFTKLKNMINSAECSEIKLEQDFKYDPAKDNLENGIEFTRSIIIDGQGYTIDAKGASRIFNINNDEAEIVLKNIIFRNAVTSDNGAAVYAKAKKVDVINCTFINNNAAGEGDALYIEGVTLQSSIEESTFINNDGSNSVVYIDSTDSNSQINDSIFVDNGATYNIKGIGNVVANYNWWGNTADDKDDDSLAKVVGASHNSWYYLNVTLNEGNVIISLDNINDGSTHTYGMSKISVSLTSVNVNLDEDSTTLENGQATVGYELTDLKGSLTLNYKNVAITKELEYVDDGSFTALQFIIDHTSDGGVINLTKNYTRVASDLALTDGIVINKNLIINGFNHTLDASKLGRIFYLSDFSYSKSLTMNNINFINSNFNQGAVYCLCNSVSITNCTFRDNYASGNPGGALYLTSKGTNIIDNCSFINNEAIKTIANGKGGAVYIGGYTSTTSFTNCSFINNSASYGAAIDIIEVGTVTVNCIDCYFVNNSAVNSGGAIYTHKSGSDSTKKTLNVERSVFVNNTANYGSAIYIWGTSSGALNVKDSILIRKVGTPVTNNIIYTGSSGATCNVNNNWWGNTDENYATITQNAVNSNTGTVTNWLYLKMDVDDTTGVASISLNNLKDGSAYTGKLPEVIFDLTSTNALINKNEVTLDGNAEGEVEYDITKQTGSLTAYYNGISLTKTISMDDSFTSLNAKISRTSEDSILTLVHDYTYDSTKDAALINGIGIAKTLTIDAQGHTIDALYQARIFNFNNPLKNLVLKNIKFVNARGDDGAAIYANCNNIEVINCTFEANKATNNGDALYVIANGCDISESTFVNNLGSNSALYLSSDMQGATFNIDNSILVNNTGANIVKDANVVLTADYNWWGNTVDNKGTDLSDSLAQNWYLLDMITDDTKSIATISLNNLWDGSAYSPCETYALPAITGNITTNAYTSSRKNKVLIDKYGDTTGYILTDENNVGQITVSYNGVSITRDINYNEESDYSFKALKKLIDQYNDNGVINLTHDYEYVIDYDTITEGITITQNNLTINGNGYTINAKEQTRIFNVGEADTTVAFDVTIKNITFVNGKPLSGQGGAIKWYGWNGNLINCTFENNSASINGGAVYLFGQNVNVTNCTFKNNIITTSYRGGAIYIQSKGAHIFNSIFSGNKAANGGGAIYIYQDNVVVNKSTFIKNTGSPTGSAIYVQANNATIINSTFIDNAVTGDGGAIYWYSGDKGTIINSTFTNNVANSNGGAIYWNIKLNIINSTFENNKATTSGGAIYCASNGGTIYNSTFINNNARNGGVIYLYTGSLDINKTDFIDNTAAATGSNKPYGGVIYDIMGTNLNIHNSNFINNGVTSVTGAAYGGVMYLSSVTFNITNSTFDKNYITSTSTSTVTTHGSVICMYNSKAKGEITNSSFLNNHGKTSQGAAFYSYGTNINVVINDSIIINNTYGDLNDLKVVYKSSGTLTFNYCWFGNTKEDGFEPKGISISYTNNPLCLYSVHDEFMAVGENKEIKYIFQYFENGTHIYDSSKLPKVNLTLSSVNGVLDKNSASMDETILFNADHFGAASITAKYNGVELTENLYAKDKPTITVDPIVVHVGENIGVNVIEKIPSDASLTFSSIDGDEFILVAMNGYVEGLKEGTSILYIKYNGNDDYTPLTVEVPVTVIKYTTVISTNLTETTPVDSLDVDWGADPQNIIIDFDPGNPNPSQSDEFKMKYKSNDTNVATVSIVGGKAYINFRSAGTANVTFYFEENEKYYGSEKNITVTVKKIASEVTVPPVELVYGSTNTSTVTGMGYDSVTAKLYLGDNEIAGAVSVEGNVVTVSADNLDVGTYILSVTTNPDNNHTSVSQTAEVVVKQAGSDAIIGTDPVSVDYGGNVVDVVSIPDNGNASGVTAALYDGDDKIKDLEVNDLTGSVFEVVVNAVNVNNGTYTLIITTVPDGNNYYAVNRTAVVLVNKAGSDVVVPTSSVIYDSSVVVTVTGLVNATGVTGAVLYAGDVKVKDLVVNDGVDVVVDATGVDNGTYTLKVTTVPADANHASVIREGIILVNKAGSDVIVPVSGEVTYASSVDITVSIPENGNASAITAKLYSGVSEIANVVIVDALKVTVDASSLDVGTYSLNVTTVTDSNHASVTKECILTVNPAGSDVVVPASSVVYDGSVVVTVTDLVNASGVNNAALYAGDVKVKDLTVNDGVDVVVDASGVDNGTYTLKVTTVPADANHASVIREGVVLVNKAGSDVIVPVSGEVTYGGSVDITVTIPENANASAITAKIYSGSTEIENALTVNALKVTVVASKLAVGTYSLNVTTVTDSNHAPVTRQCIITVNPAGSEVIVPASTDVNYTESADIIVTIPENGNASAITAKLYLGDNEITNVLSVDALKVTVDASSLDVGTYTLKVTTVPSDTNHTFATREASVNVVKIDSTVTFLPSEILFAYEDEGLTIAECIGCTIDVENVTVIGHPEAVIKLEGNKITVSNLIEDEYMMKVITTPDKNHLSIEKTVKVTVSGISSKMSMEVSNITYGEKETVFITMDTVATGIVNITIFEGNEIVQSKNITINNRFNKTVFENLKVGTYTITAHYYGTQNYNEATIPDTFTVHPVYNLEFDANVNDTICGSKTNATVTLSPDASGSIQIGNIIKSIEGPVTVIELPVQNIAGKNNVSVKYIPDKNSKYGESEIVVYYNVAKKQTEITIADITGKKVGDDVEIIASAYDGAVLNIYVDGVKLDSNKLEDVTAGTHTVVVNVAETSQYLAGSANITFTVLKHDVSVSVEGTPVFVGEKSTVSVSCNVSEGIVVVNVNGSEYSVDLANGNSFEIAMPNVGVATVTARYVENNKYNAKAADAASIVVTNKSASDIVVQIPDNIKVGDVVIINVTTSNPQLEVTVDGEKQTVADGKITFTASKAGIYNIIAKTNETSEIFGEVKFASFEVTKKSAEIIIADISGKKVGDDVVIDASAYAGANIVLYVDGVKLDSNTIENITAGSHTVIATVAETDEYLQATANKTFTVAKHDVSVSVEGTPVFVGEKSTVSVSCNVSEGIVVVNVNGSEYSIDLANGNSFDVAMPNVGVVPVTARYVENNKYNAKVADGATIEVTNKSASDIVVQIPDAIKVGDVVVINVTTSNPELEVTVDGEKQTVTDGKITFTASKAGIYNIIAKTNETSEIFGEVKFASFEVTKKSAEITIADISTKKVGDDVVIDAASYAGADIVLYVDGVKLDSNTIVNITAGSHTVIARVAETDEYLSATANRTFIVAKHDVILSVKGNDTKVGEISTITLICDADYGTVILNINDAQYSINVSDKNTLDVVMPKVGIITFTAKFLENNKYNAKDAQGSVIVSNKAESNIVIEIPDDIKVGQSVEINVTTRNPELEVTVNGDSYTVSDGKITFTPVEAGIYNIVARANQTSEYFSDNKFASFEVTKKAAGVVISDITPKMVGDDIVVEVSSYDGADIVVYVDGAKQTLTDNKFTIKAIAGNHTIIASVAETNEYLAGSANKSFSVSKYDVDLNVIATPVFVGEKSVITVTCNASEGIVVVSVNGSEYSLDLANGNTFEVVMPNVGVASITARYLENDKYNAKDAQATFIEVDNKTTPEIVIQIPENIKVGQMVAINVTAYDGADIAVYLDGVKQTLDENNSFTIKAATGTHTISASVDETREYFKASADRAFEVTKYDVEIIVSGSATKVGEKSTITVDANVSEGIVVINVNGSEYSINLTNGNYIEIVMPKVGSIPLTARYLENEMYNAKDADASAIEVSNKTPSDIIIQVPGDVKVGDVVTINVTTSNPEFEVTIDGIRQTVTDGKITFTAAKADIYNIVAHANETYDYFADTIFASFEVAKKTAEITIADISPKMVGDDVLIEVSSNSDAEIVVYVDGVKQTLTDNNVTVKATAGNHMIIANVAETEEYLSASANKTFTVSKYDVNLTVSGTQVFVGEKSTITVDTNVSEGIVVISVNGSEYSINLTNGNAIEVMMPNVGSIPLTARYLENDKYNAKVAEPTTIEVKLKETPSITIEADKVVVVGDEMSINVASNGYNLTVSVLFNDEILISENASFTFTPQRDGVYTIIAKTAENDTYYASENSTSFAAINRTKETPSIIISDIKDAKVGEEINFTVDAIGGGDAVVKINDETITPKDGVYSYTPKKGGIVVLTVETPENERYTKGFNVTTFNVERKQAKINISVEGDLVVDKNIKINVESFDGADIAVYMDGKVFEDWETPFKATAGDHLVIATVAENDEYLGASGNITFTVDKKESDVYVSGSHAVVGEKSILEVELTKGATGMVIVNVDGTEYSLNITQNNTLAVVFNEVGLHNISAKYLGDDKYLSSESEMNTVYVEDKQASTIVVEIPSEITAGDTVTIDISSNNGNLEAFFDGVKTDIADGKITIENITAGSHRVEVTAKETSEYKANATADTFNVAKKESMVIIELPEGIVAGNDVEINVTSNSGADIIVYIDGEKQTVKDGKVTFKATAGSHTIIANAAETDSYLASMANRTFVVDKLSAEISVSGLNITEGEKTTITIETPLNDGIVSVKVAGFEGLIDLAKTKSVEVQIDAPGDYDVVAVYLANDIYKETKANATINVAEKQDPAVEINSSGDANKSEIEISLPDDASGTLTVTVDGNTTYSVDVVNGSASVDIPDLGAGNHNISVSYSGDGKYASVSKNTTVNVPKADIPENATEIDMTIPEGTTSPVVTVNLPGDAGGNVTVTVDGNDSYTASVVNGSATVDIPELSVGNHSMTVVYSGDAKYSPVIKNATVDVPKADIPENATEIDIEVPEGTTSPVVNVTLPGDAGGNITVTVDGNDSYTASVVNGSASVNIPELNAGVHNITVGYSGDAKYRSISKDTSVDVPQAEIPENATEIDIDIPEGTTSSDVNVTLPSDASGNITVTVDGVKKYTASLINGTVAVDIPELSPGTHDIVVEYSGSEKYAPFTKKSSVKVDKVNMSKDDVVINIDLPIASKTPTVNVTLPADATGYIVVNNSGVCLFCPIENAKASVSLGTLSYGEHNITVIYSGNDKYNPVDKNATFNVPKPVVSAKNVSCRYSNTIKYKALVTVDGKAVAGQNVTFTFNGKTYKRLTDKNGYATLKVYTSKFKVKTYKVTSKFNDVSVTKKFKINNVIVAKNVKVKKSAKYNKIKVTLKKVGKKYLKGKTVKIKLNGKTYKAKTNKKGVATFKIKKSALKKLKVGKKYKYKVTYGRNTVTKKITVKR